MQIIICPFLGHLFYLSYFDFKLLINPLISPNFYFTMLFLNRNHFVTMPIVLFVFEHYFVVLAIYTSEHNRIRGVMVSMLDSSAVDGGSEHRSGPTKVYENGMCCFYAKHATLRRKSKDWLARIHDNISE